jgi:hypothetical protein
MIDGTAAVSLLMISTISTTYRKDCNVTWNICKRKGGKRKHRDSSKANLLINERAKGSLSVTLNGLQINFCDKLLFIYTMHKNINQVTGFYKCCYKISHHTDNIGIIMPFGNDKTYREVLLGNDI